MDAESEDSLDSWLDARFDYEDRENVPEDFPTLTSVWTQDSSISVIPLPEVKTPPKVRQKYRQDPRHNSGRKPFRQIFPNLIPTVNEFIGDNGFSAHERRRSTTGRSCGTSLDQLRRHVISTAKCPNDVSTVTLRRLMEPPSKLRNSRKQYKGLVKAKVASKRNDVRKKNEDGHYYAARMRYRLEFGRKFEDETIVISADCMNKVNIGGLAVSRYHQIRRIFPNDDRPNVPDHDFPIGKGYKITPSGYMILKSKPGFQKTTQDNLGRTVYQFPRTGPSFLFNRVARFRSVSVQSHVNDLDKILSSREGVGKTMVILSVDGGPDWNPKSWTVQLYLQRLFKRWDLDLLCLSTYGPGLSALNMIEHLWSPLSDKLSAVSLPAVLHGEEIPPSQQTGLTEEEKEEKEVIVFDTAMDRCAEYWEGATFDGYQVEVASEYCKGQDFPWADYDKVHAALQNPTKASMKNHPEILSELKFIAAHCDRRLGEFTLMKCMEQLCTFCHEHLVRNTNAMEEILGRGMPTPTVNSLLQTPSRHFYTFREAMERPFQPADEDMELYKTLNLGRCSQCRYVFTSKKDKRQHVSILHG
ncbi:hypothetical protein HOLleu_41765 [Holothuria leucospilota]|uniref:C2H2-type domain-containing protein n=1 Tax=Holothuria leucospilota TaxID=206669 RepID=A0A9Q1BCB1_HOLLE|nr:hypothetical protein HOLleu_41765 [Holothuria leucospilota]